MPNYGRETYWFDRFRQALGPELQGLALRGERPDLLVEDRGRTLGVELTEFQTHVPRGHRPRREISSFRKGVVERARQLFSEVEQTPVKVVVRFSEGNRVRRIDGEGLAAHIAGVASKHAPDSARPFEKSEVPWDELPEEVDEITITVFPPEIEGYWHDPSAQWVAPVGSEEIMAQVSRKQQSLLAARTRCDALWLVIVNDPFTDGEAVELGTGNFTLREGGPLDRLYWLDPLHPRAVSLR